jgi:GNAT superfamily N-acetyltransferase
MICPATPDDADALSALMFASKAHWGYDPAFMEACRAELTFSAHYLGRSWVIEAHGQNAAVLILDGQHAPDAANLLALFVHPDHMGKGYGRYLWNCAVEQALAAGKSRIVIESDPNAQPFYERMGAVKVGDVPSGSIAGRRGDDGRRHRYLHQYGSLLARYGQRHCHY